MTKKQRRTFNVKFKQMIPDQCLSVMEVRRDMNLGQTAMRRWRAQRDAAAAGS